MLLRELLSDPGLRLHLLYGEDALERPLLSVTTIDLLDPRRYLRPGALVLTGLMWRRTAADSETFVQALAEYDVVALGAGEAALGSVPRDLVEACRRHRIALVQVPVEVAFTQVSDRVAQAREAERERQIATAFDRQRRLVSAVAEGRGFGALLHLVADELGVRCRVLTATGREVAALDPPVPADRVDLIVAAYLRADRLPAAVSGVEETYTIVPVDSGLTARATGWFLTVPGDHTGWGDAVRSTIDELASAVALERSRLDDGGRVERRIADEIVALVAAGQVARAEMAARLRDLGVDPAGPFLVAVAAFADRADLTGMARVLLHDAALHLTDRPVTGVADAQVVSMITAPPGSGDGAQLRTVLARVEPGLGRGSRLVVGLSAVVPPDALAGALDGARHAWRAASLRGGAVTVMTADDVTSHVLLLAAVPDDVRRTFADRLLRTVLDHDARHASELVPTLRAFLDADGSWSRCATALHVHVNTVRYRIGRIEQLTNRDLARTEDRVDLFLALRSLP
ncbi:MAG: PucR family transcriptional regulator [Jiangellaceae bacterium]